MSGAVLDVSGTGVRDVAVSFNIQNPTLSADPVEGSTTTDANGAWSLALQQGLSGIFTMLIPSSSVGQKHRYTFNVNIPSATSATFSSILVD